MRTMDFLLRAYDFVEKNGYKKDETGKAILDNFNELQKATIEDVSSYLDWCALNERKSDYASKVNILSNAPEFKEWSINILCSALNSFFREKRQQAERDNSTSTYVGKEKDKVFLKIKDIRKLFTNDFGYHIYRIVGEDGNVFIISTQIYNLKPGDELKGTVKGFKDYKGEKQTLLNRITRLNSDNFEESLVFNNFIL